MATPSARPRAHRRTRIALAATGALAALAAAGYVWLSAGASPRVTGHPDCHAAPVTGPVEPGGPDHRAVCAVLGDLTAAWDAHDADAYGALFTADATYTSWVGTHYAGRQDIVAGHRALFDGVLGSTRLTDRVLSVRFATPDVALVATRGDTYETAPPAQPSKVQTYTVVRDGGAWRIASFHNSARRPVLERVQFLWMPGSRPEAER